MKIDTPQMKKWIKSFAGQLIFGFRLHHLLLANSAVVVAFHRVNNTTVGDELTCSVKAFERYCRFFAHHFNVVPLRHIVQKLESGSALDRELAITFDDGFRDNYEYAAPVLKAMDLPATFFVVNQFIGTQFAPWWLKDRMIPQPWMTWDQVQSLRREGFEVGAHTRNHADLGEVFGDKAEGEILGSRIELEEKLSVPVDLFAYPFGEKENITEENRNRVKAAGFRCCCSCFGGINTYGKDPFHLWRIPIISYFGSPHHFGFEVALGRV